jgi:hypothetical protein
VHLRLRALQIRRGGGHPWRPQRRSGGETQRREGEEQAQEQAKTEQELPDHASLWSGSLVPPAPHRAALVQRSVSAIPNLSGVAMGQAPGRALAAIAALLTLHRPCPPPSSRRAPQVYHDLACPAHATIVAHPSRY